MSKISTEFEVAQGLNDTYLQCIKSMQRVSNWLQTYNDGEFQLYEGDSEDSLCSFLDKEIGERGLNKSNCQTIYSGILQKTTLQSASLFLHDIMYTAIKYLSPDQTNRTA